MRWYVLVPLGAAFALSACTEGGLNPAADLSAVTTRADSDTIGVTPPVLLAPPAGALIRQNNPRIGCPANPDRGFGFAIPFDWGDSPSIEVNAFELEVRRRGAHFPALDAVVPAGHSNYTWIACNSFVADFNLDGWGWRVRNLTADSVFGGWSAYRPFAFQPCRLPDGRPCTAPDSVPRDSLPPPPPPDSTPPDTTIPPPPPPDSGRGVVLDWPFAGAVIAQNDPATGCSNDPARGYGIRITFSWVLVPGRAGVVTSELFVKRSGSPLPLISQAVSDTSLTYISCNAFVIDANLSGWQWQVRALYSDGTASPWTPLRNFSFAPCRLSDGRACYAPGGAATRRNGVS